MAKDLTKGKPFPVLLQFTMPVIGGNLFQLFYTLADTVIVGRTLGDQPLQLTVQLIGASSSVWNAVTLCSRVSFSLVSW